ncbi:MAG: fibronectin type III domain-containing protein [Bacteroidota bacterium]
MKKLTLYILFFLAVPAGVFAQYTGGFGRGDSAILIPAYNPSCINPTAGGTIGADQASCGQIDPNLLTSLTLPSGQTGTLEYKWQQSTTSSSTGFTDIAGSNSATYDPAIVTQTTWFKRLARVACQTNWTGAAESNVVTITIESLPTITLSSSTIVVSGGTTLENLFYTATTGSPDTYSLDYDSIANAMGFADIENAPLTPGQIVLSIPPGAAALSYNAILTVTHNATGCNSLSYPIVLTVTGFSYTITQDIGTALLLTWTTIPDASQYVIQYGLHGSGTWLGAPAYTNQAKLSNLQANTAYDCRIGVFKNGIFWGYTSLGSFTTANVNYTKTLDIGTTMQISWNSFAPWATMYAIQYRVSGSSTWIGAPATTNLVKISNLIPDTDYECQIRVYKNTLWGTCQTYNFHTGKVQFNSCQDIGTTILLGWTAFTGNASSYNIQHRQTGTSTWISQIVYNNPAKVTNLLPETSYEFRVTPYVNNTTYGTSQIDTITTDKVKLVTMADNFTSMDIGWVSLAPWATSYVLEFTLPGVPNWISTAPTTLNDALMTPIAPGQDYFLRLKVYIGTDLWGTSKEQKIGRNNPPLQNIAGVETNGGSSINMNVYPNPFMELINLDINAVEESQCQWTLYDMNGRVVMKNTEVISEGNNTIDIKAIDLPKGMYMLSTIMSNEKHDFRILKQ